MSTLHIELSEYDAMRNRNKELEERVKQLEEELKGCKDGSRVIIRKVMEQKEAGRFLYYDHPQRRSIYSSEQPKEIVVSENYINFEDVRVKIEDKMKFEDRMKFEDTMKIEDTTMTVDMKIEDMNFEDKKIWDMNFVNN